MALRSRLNTANAIPEAVNCREVYELRLGVCPACVRMKNSSRNGIITSVTPSDAPPSST